MRAMMRLANLKWRMDARARRGAGILMATWGQMMQSMSPLSRSLRFAHAESSEEPPVRAGMPYLAGDSSPEVFVPRRSPLWRRIARLPGVFIRRYLRLRDLNRSRWQALVTAARMALHLLK